MYAILSVSSRLHMTGTEQRKSELKVFWHYNSQLWSRPWKIEGDTDKIELRQSRFEQVCCLVACKYRRVYWWAVHGQPGRSTNKVFSILLKGAFLQNCICLKSSSWQHVRIQRFWRTQTAELWLVYHVHTPFTWCNMLKPHWVCAIVNSMRM